MSLACVEVSALIVARHARCAGRRRQDGTCRSAPRYAEIDCRRCRFTPPYAELGTSYPENLSHLVRHVGAGLVGDDNRG
jgi:hypothetical protein